MSALVFSDFCCPVEVSCWPDDACAYSYPLLLPRCEIFSRKTIRWEQLELGHRGWAHLDTNFYSRADLTEVSLEVTFKATSGECTCFEDSPWLSFKHFPFVFLGMMHAWLSQFFLTEEVFLCVENGSCIKKKNCRKELNVCPPHGRVSASISVFSSCFAVQSSRAASVPSSKGSVVTGACCRWACHPLLLFGGLFWVQIQCFWMNISDLWWESQLQDNITEGRALFCCSEREYAPQQ